MNRDDKIRTERRAGFTWSRLSVDYALTIPDLKRICGATPAHEQAEAIVEAAAAPPSDIGFPITPGLAAAVDRLDRSLEAQEKAAPPARSPALLDDDEDMVHVRLSAEELTRLDECAAFEGLTRQVFASKLLRVALRQHGRT